MTAYRVAIPYQIMHDLIFLYSVYRRRISPFSFSFYYSKTPEYKLTSRRALYYFELAAPRMQSWLCISARLIHAIENQITSCLKGNRVFKIWSHRAIERVTRILLIYDLRHAF